MKEPRLTPDEDAELRRLHLLKSFGTVGRSITSRYQALKGRDRRKSIRDPDDASIAQPIQKSSWASDDRRSTVAVERPAPESSAVDEPAPAPVDASRSRSDTRQVVAGKPTRKSLFRR